MEKEDQKAESVELEVMEKGDQKAESVELEVMEKEKDLKLVVQELSDRIN